MMNSYQETLADEAATLAFGQRLARASFRDPGLKPEAGVAEQGVPSLGGVIHLQGDLGAGKTTLTRGIMRGYGYEGAVKSPTYTLVEPYEFLYCKIYHFDLYRLGDPEEVAYLGTEDYFHGDNLCIIEWPAQGRGVIPAPDLLISLGGTGTGRELDCQSQTEKGAVIAKRLWD